MPIENCPCGGNAMDRFYSLFTCDHVCSHCHWTFNQCCNGCYADESACNCKGDCVNFYDIKLKPVLLSKIKAFGYCDNHKALGVQYTDGNKKLFLNVEKDIYDGLVELNKDLLSMYLESNLTEDNQCIVIP